MAALLVLRVVLFVVGSLCYALLNVLSQLSKEPDGSYAYSMPAVVLLAEFVKLCLSLGFLAREEGSLLSALRLVVTTPRSVWAAFAVPSVLYAINNNLDMLNNQYMDPATESVLVQLKILTTGIMWRLVFGKPLGTRKWLSLVLLFLGCSIAGWPKSNTTANSMFILPFGLVLVGFYVCISATAGVYNEWLYKGLCKTHSIHVCNIRIYTVGVLFCLCAHLASVPPREGPAGGVGSYLSEIVRGYNVYTWALVGTYSVMGLLLAQVMKFFDSIVKLFISGSSMYASAFLTAVIFGRVPDATFLLALTLVTVAIITFNIEKITPLFSGSKEQ